MDMPTAKANYVGRILAGLADDPDRIAFHLVDGSHVRHGEFADLIHRLAHVLAEHGVRAGSTVTFLSGNRFEVLAARYAANLLGARIVFLYGGLAVDAQATIVSDVDTGVLVVDDDLADRAARILALTSVDTVFSLGSASVGADLLELAAAAPDSPVPVCPVSPTDAWSIRHTGGTTGHPKGILMPFGGYLVRPEQHTDEEGGGLVEDPVFLACTTVAHAAGLIVDMTLIGGGTIVLHERFDPSAVLAAIPRHRVTALFLLPPLLYQLVDHPSLDSTDLSSLSRVVYGGCAAAPSRLARAIDRLGPVLFQFYGQSEAGGISMLTEQDHLRPELLSTVGRVMPGVEIAIRDEEGRDLPRGTVGEICVRSAMISGGYWRNPELTAEVWRDGWVHTGDVGHLDDEGYLHLSDRIKDMIIVVGGHVYPTELEDVLLGHPAVAQAAVYGVRDADAVERVHAALVTNPGHRPELAEIQRYVESRLGPMYAPSHIEILDEIPLTDAGKPDKKVLRQRHMGATH